MKFKLLFIIPFILLAIGLIFLAANVPIGDDYDAILNYLNWPWPDRFFHLADFHNEHRIIPTRFVSEIIYRALGHIDFRAVIWIGNLGWWIFAGGFAWLFWKRGGTFHWGAIFACWMLVGYYDIDNTFWAMASIQNHWVLAFAFAACLAFSRRKNWKWFAASLAFAVTATFTSGGGLIIFPSLALMEICDRLFDRDHMSSKKQLAGILIFCILAVVASGLMLHNFPHNENAAIALPTQPTDRITCATSFFLSFLGNLIPFVKPAIAIGVAIVFYGIFICRFAPRYRRTSLAIFAFLAFCVAQILAASMFRGRAPSLALAGRYRLISASIIVSLMYLTLVEIPLATTVKKRLLTFALISCFLFSAIHVVRGVRYTFHRKHTLIMGISHWPETDEDLDYPTNGLNRVHASAILKKSVDARIYLIK